ncbi:peptidase M28 [Flavobacteriales bacterium 34_180_T64]|nr:peptidase M28 [Flavobacteriales bacterium 34_180_T64]
MKVLLFATVLSLVGTCASKRHTEKIQDIKDNIRFEDSNYINEYANSITAQELSNHVYHISSDEFEGRKTGEQGHYKAAHFLKDYYISENIGSPLGQENYYQQIPEPYFPDGIKSSQNILAFIEGSEYPEEIVIISAHLDHLGIDDATIFNGADDNGSGTAALLEMAQAFKKAELAGFGPKRSILFLHLTGEEEGLIGSRYYSDHPVFSLDETVVNLNIDMIGRVDENHADNPNYIYIIGADRLSTELHYISEAVNSNFTNLTLDYTLNSDSDTNRYYYRSDHYNFALNDIPVIFYFSGEHADYHLATDTAEKLDYELLEKRTQLIFSTAWYIANSEFRLIADKS